jgi:hypothetical protein
MTTFKMPLSGNVTQSILPWNWLFNSSGNQVSLVSIDLGSSSAPAVEEDVLRNVGSYGKQLGKIEDALQVLLNTYTPSRVLTEPEEKAIAELRSMIASVDGVKKRHGRR